MTTAKVGKDIDSWCTKCKLVLAHTVEAMANGKVTRVHCNTCGGQHAYRATAPGQKAATRRRSSADAPAPASDYQTLLRGRSPDSARPYSISGRFRPGELIAHPTFGVGAVTAEKDGTKIEVVFPDGARMLVHGR
jgi:hypothetical protein